MERGHDGLTSLIDFYCSAHSELTVPPIVTMHERRWAYCPGGLVGAADGHRWIAIDPVNVAEVHAGRMHDRPIIQ